MDSRSRSIEGTAEPNKGDQRLRSSSSDVSIRTQSGSQASSPGAASSTSGDGRDGMKLSQEGMMTLGDHIDAIIIKDYDNSKPGHPPGLQLLSEKGAGSILTRIQDTSSVGKLA